MSSNEEVPCEADVGQVLQSDGLFKAVLIVLEMKRKSHMGWADKQSPEAASESGSLLKISVASCSIGAKLKLKPEMTLAAKHRLHLKEGSAVDVPNNAHQVTDLKDNGVGRSQLGAPAGPDLALDVNSNRQHGLQANQHGQ